MLCTSMECEGGLTDRSTDKLVREAAGFGPCALMDRSTDKLTDRSVREWSEKLQGSGLVR